MSMDMDDVSFANLDADVLRDIRNLEKRISEAMHREIMLLAYEEADQETDIPYEN